MMTHAQEQADGKVRAPIRKAPLLCNPTTTTNVTGATRIQTQSNAAVSASFCGEKRPRTNAPGTKRSRVGSGSAVLVSTRTSVISSVQPRTGKRVAQSATPPCTTESTSRNSSGPTFRDTQPCARWIHVSATAAAASAAAVERGGEGCPAVAVPITSAERAEPRREHRRHLAAAARLHVAASRVTTILLRRRHLLPPRRVAADDRSGAARHLGAGVQQPGAQPIPGHRCLGLFLLRQQLARRAAPPLGSPAGHVLRRASAREFRPRVAATCRACTTRVTTCQTPC